MHPILLRIPLPFSDNSIPIYTYGFMMVIAFVSAMYLAARRARKTEISQEVIMDIGLYSIICGIFGARLAFVVDGGFDATSDHPILDMFAIWQGGLTFQGGLFMALIVCIWYLRSRKISAGKVADIFAPGIAIGVAIGRIGCFLNGCCWGKICRPDFPLGVVFPEDSGPYKHHFNMLTENNELFDRLGETGNQTAMELLASGDLSGLMHIPVHPAQLYTSAALLATFFIVLLIDKLPKRFDGQVMLAFLAIYSVVRFGIETVRDDTPLLMAWWGFPGLRLGQILAGLTFIAVSIIFSILWSRNPLRRESGDKENP